MPEFTPILPKFQRKSQFKLAITWKVSIMGLLNSYVTYSCCNFWVYLEISIQITIYSSIFARVPSNFQRWRKFNSTKLGAMQAHFEKRSTPFSLSTSPNIKTRSVHFYPACILHTQPVRLIYTLRYKTFHLHLWRTKRFGNGDMRVWKYSQIALNFVSPENKRCEIILGNPSILSTKHFKNLSKVLYKKNWHFWSFKGP